MLRDRLRRAGFTPTVLHYSSMHSTLEEAAEKLRERLRSFGAGPAHVVAHSLGGLVTLEAYAREEGLPPGRVVLLGSPVQGSRAARAVAQWGHGQQVLGPLAHAELCVDCERHSPDAREVGVIAGSRSAGLGRLLAELPVPNDGTVCVEETRLPGMASHVVHDVSHTGMLFSSAVAASTVQFLAMGSFRQA